MVRTHSRLASLALVLAVAAPAAAQESVYKKGLKSTVWIFSVVERRGNQVSGRTGSGSVIDLQKRLVLTNYHVVEDTPEAIVCFPQYDKKGELIPEKDKYQAVLGKIGIKGLVIARDLTRDLAVIQLPKDAVLPRNVQRLPLARKLPEPGDKVHSIGSPGLSGALFNYTGGEVKSVYHKDWQAMRRPDDPSPLKLSAKVIETSSGTNQGDSGGPLMNDRGELVGVTQGGTFRANSNPISYFIAVTEVQEMLKKNKIMLSNATAVAEAAPKADAPAATSGATVLDDTAKKESAAASKLDLAKQLAAGGKPEKAAERYREIVEKFPETKAAAEAKALLEKK